MYDNWRNIEDNVKAVYLDRLKLYKKRGIKVLIDGVELPEEEWHCIFSCNEDCNDQSRMFYMADFVAEPEGEHISEVRFDKVYVKDFSLI